MDDYKRRLREHLEKLYKKLVSTVSNINSGNKRKLKGILNYYSYYLREKERGDKGYRRKYHNESYKDVLREKPFNAGFRNQKPIKYCNPSVEELERMVEFYERKLEAAENHLDMVKQYDIYLGGDFTSVRSRASNISWDWFYEEIKVANKYK